MNIKKLAAGALAAVTAGATFGAVAFGALDDYVTTSNGALASPMIVIGNPAVPSADFAKDVLGAADIAAHVAGFATTPVTVSGGDKNFALTGEGEEVATSNTKIFLDDSLGKSGLKSTMTKDDLPTLLASGSVTDTNATTIKYDQFLFLTPNSTTDSKWILQFDRPSSSSSDDGTYSFGRFQTSPWSSDAGYFANYRLNFKKDTDFSAMVGKTLTIAGETYTVLADSSSVATTPVLVTTKAAASQSIIVSDGDVEITVGDTTHTVRVLGTSDANTVVVSVNGVSSSATKSQTTTINGVEVYVDDVFHFANNQESSGAKLLIGAEKTRFQHNSKVKVGSDETNVDGTYVRFTQSGGKVTTMDVYFGAPASSVTDNLKMGSSYTFPTLSNLVLYFPGLSEGLMADSRNTLKIAPSGDNLMQLTWTDDSLNENTITWAYKSSATGTSFQLADSNGKNITVVEAEPVTIDEYVVLDAGDFPHMMQLTGVDSSALSFTLRDVFSGDSVKHDLSVSDNGQKTIYIDGQAYYAKYDATNTSINFTWGDGATYDSIGEATTVWPTLKGKNTERLAFINELNVTLNATNGKEIQLPTGAVTITTAYGLGDVNVTLTATTDEDGESSACTSSPCLNQFSIEDAGTNSFTLGKTSTGGVNYTIQSGANNNTFAIHVSATDGNGAAAITQPGLLLFEEKDDSSNRYSVIVTATTETSGSNNIAIPAAPFFTYNEDSQSRGTDSTITDYVDLYGTYAVRTTSGQDVVTIYYPDEQVYAVIGAGEADKTASVGGATGSTVNQAVQITSPVAKLATEINTATLASDLILIGGPCANSLVATLAADNATGIPACDAWTLSTGLIKEVDDAFSSGRKALVVAGTTADDTRSLAAMVMQGTLNYEV